MKFEKLSSAAVNTNRENLPQRMFPAGHHKAVLKVVKTKDKKTGRVLKTKKGFDKYLLVWEVLDGKGKPFTTVFDNHIDNELEPHGARKFAHMVEAINFEPEQDEFFFELADALQESYIGVVFTVAFKESQDGQAMEVDLFTDEGVPIYEIEDTVKGKNKKEASKKSKKTKTAEDEDEDDEFGPLPDENNDADDADDAEGYEDEEDGEDEEDDLLDAAQDELDEELGESDSEDF